MPAAPDELAQWRQGDVIDVGGFVLLDLDEDSLEVVNKLRNQRVAVITQTCDVVRNPDIRPDIVVAPLVTLEGDALAHSLSGSSPRYAHLPGIGDDQFVDLDAAMTISKSLMVRSQKTRGLTSNRERRAFSRAVGRKFSRIALPNDIQKTLLWLQKRVQDKIGKPESPEGILLRDHLYQIRIEVDPDDDWFQEAIEVRILFILPDYQISMAAIEVAPDAEVEAWFDDGDRASHQIAARLLEGHDEATTQWLWEKLCESWLANCDLPPSGRILTLQAEVTTADQFGLNRVEKSEVLDLDYLSIEDTE